MIAHDILYEKPHTEPLADATEAPPALSLEETEAFEAIANQAERQEFADLVAEIDTKVTSEMEEDLRITMTDKDWGLNNQVLTKN